MNCAFKTIVAAALGAAACASTLALAQQRVATDAYALDTSGRIVKSAFGLCWRTTAWTAAKAIAECDPDLVAKPAPAAAPVAVPAPVAAPAAPVPAPVAAPAAPVPAPVAPAAPAPIAQALDSDGDGVLDRLDKCPGTRAGVKVDATGCEIPEAVVLKGVNFATNSAQLTAGSTAILDEAAATLIKRGDVRTEIAGHTDNRGSPARNRVLSQQRAEAVMRYLASKGVSTANLTARGYGQDNPIADNATQSGRTANRRVELRAIK